MDASHKIKTKLYVWLAYGFMFVSVVFMSIMEETKGSDWTGSQGSGLVMIPFMIGYILMIIGSVYWSLGKGYTGLRGMLIGFSLHIFAPIVLAFHPDKTFKSPPVESNKPSVKEKTGLSIDQSMDINSSDLKSTENEILKKALGAFAESNKAKKIHFAPGIPQKKVVNATNKMKVPYGQNVLVLIDDTLMESGKEGLVITSDYVCWNSEGDSGCMEIKKIKSFNFKLGFVIKILINSNNITLVSFLKEEIQPFTDFFSSYLKEIAELEKQRKKNSRDVKRTIIESKDHHFISKVATEDPDPALRKVAVKKLEDQNVLYKIALKTDELISIRKSAIEALSEQKLIYEFILQTKNYKYRVLAFERLKDQKMIASIALEDKDRGLRSSAIEKLSDNYLLSEIALKSKDKYDREAAVEKLEDQESLADVAKNDSSGTIRKKAVEKLDPSKWQDLLAGIAKKDEKYDVRKEAVEKLDPGKWSEKWQGFLEDIARNDKSWESREIAVKKLDNEKVLAEVAKNDKCILVRKEAINKLDPNKYKDLIDRENNRKVGIKHPKVMEADRIRLVDKKNDKALSILISLIKDDPSSLEGGAFHVMGYIFMDKGALNLALDYFNKNLKIFPNDPSTCMCIGLIHEILGRTKKAEEYYSKASNREWDHAYVDKIRKAYEYRSG